MLAALIPARLDADFLRAIQMPHPDRKHVLHPLATRLLHGQPAGPESLAEFAPILARRSPFATPAFAAAGAQKHLVGVLPVPASDFDEFVEHLAAGLAARQPRIPGAHLIGAFFGACFTHAHGWRHGVLICEATGPSSTIREFFSVSASMRQHAIRRRGEGALDFVGTE